MKKLVIFDLDGTLADTSGAFSGVTEKRPAAWAFFLPNRSGTRE